MSASKKNEHCPRGDGLADPATMIREALNLAKLQFPLGILHVIHTRLYVKGEKAWTPYKSGFLDDLRSMESTPPDAFLLLFC